jgi:endonuclease YncB( thermonuclease family)
MGWVPASAALIAILFAAGIARAEVRVIDGDTLVLDGLRVRLAAIDAPEARQACRDRQGQSWPCGLAARAALAELVEGESVRCEARGQDRYGRTVARCLAGQKDLGAELVRRGMALSHYGTDYAVEEIGAMVDGVGLWGGDFTMPWDWRRDRMRR